MKRRHAAAALVGMALVTVVMVSLSPLRELSGDTVPGRVGALVLRCGGDLNLERIDWVRKETSRGRMFYFMQRDQAKQFTSLFGPAPAVVGAFALLDIGQGDTLSDESLRNRERTVGALLVGLAAILVALAALARVPLPRAIATGAICVLSFAGAASLGQGLWQATLALPCLAGALTTLAWRDQRPRVALVTPALLVLAIMIRPGVAPLCLALGIAWAVETRLAWRTWAIAAVIAAIAALPFVLWNVKHLNSPLSIAQWQGNLRLNDHVFTLAAVPRAIAGLFTSPARGILWFAPVALVGLVIALRSRTWTWRIVAIGCLLQLVLMAAFFKWHGGQNYGPRMLSEMTWVAIFLALGLGVPLVANAKLSRALLYATAAITIVVGQLGLWLYTPEQWERRRLPERHPAALWDWLDSPIPATLSTSTLPIAHDSPPVSSWRCTDGHLHTVPSP